MHHKYNLAVRLAQAAIVTSPLAADFRNGAMPWTQYAITSRPEGQIHLRLKGGEFLVGGNHRSPLEIRFRELATTWRKETSFQSSLAAKFNHSAYRAVIDMGFDVIPLLLNELVVGSKHWTYALSKIVGFDVGASADNPKDAAEAWLRWGRSVQLISKA